MSLRWLLTGLLLLEAGVSEEVIRRRMVEHAAFRKAWLQMKTWLPDIFGPAY